MDLVALLRNAGVPNVRDERVTPRPGTFKPIGVLNHHTAIAGNGLRSCKVGRPDLPGPLCNINISRSLQVNVVSDGVANHAGKGALQAQLRLARDLPPLGDARDHRSYLDVVNGNVRLIGIEIDNNGTWETYSPELIDLVVRVNAALCAAYGWSANRCIHHREWTKRKIDMSWRGDLRGLVAARLNPQEPDLERRYEVVTVPAVWNGTQVVHVPGYRFEKCAGATIKANDDGRPVKATVQVVDYAGQLMLSFVGLDGQPVPPGKVGVVLAVEL